MLNMLVNMFTLAENTVILTTTKKTDSCAKFEYIKRKISMILC